jgi:transposase
MNEGHSGQTFIVLSILSQHFA